MFLQSYDRSDLILLSGGLGPTEDDLTKEIVAEALELPLVKDEKAWEMLQSYFVRFHRPMAKNNEKQAFVPQGCKALYNENGTAPGILIEKDGKIIVILPGPPGELYPMFEEQVIPYLKSRSDKVLVSKMIKVVGVGESNSEMMLLDLIDGQENPTIATYAKVGEVHIRVTAQADSEEEANALLAPTVSEVCARMGKHVFTIEEDVTLELAISEKLIAEGKTLAIAESCTGGLLSGRLIGAAGISACYKEGFITYANEAKEKYLHVSRNTLETYGAVSEECAFEMCKGALEASGADYALVTTGVAGPGASENKPAGLVYIGVGTPDGIMVYENHFRGTRQNIRERSVATALTRLWLSLNEEKA